VLSEEPDAPAVPGDAPAAPTEHPPGDLPGAPAEDLPPSPVAPTPAPTTPTDPVQPPPGTPPNLDVAPRLVHVGREPALPQVRVRGRRKAANRRSATTNPPAETQAPVLGAAPTTAAQSTPPAHIASLATTPAPNPPPGIPRLHLVRPGHSLWSIAKSLLGRRATTPAIAAEVARLWRLNDQRIGTGDPNLLPVGVKLRLR
jgi:hypothetical protein